MAITNWAQVGASAHQGSMDRAQLQLARRRQAQSEQAQRFGQQRAMAQDAEAKRRYDDQQRMRERAYADQREDTAWQRGQAERAYADQRADAAYARERQGRMDNLAWEREARLQEADAFNQLLRQQEMEQRQALFERQNAEYQKLQQQEDERKAAMEASFASLLSNGIARGQRDARGNILIPKQYIDVFNNATGSNLYGLVMATQDGHGNPLPFPQILTLEQQVGQDGKPMVDPNTRQPVIRASAMPKEQIQAMFQAFPGVPQSFGQTMPQQTVAWMQTLGLGGSGGMDDRDRLDYEKWAYEQDAKDYRALAGASLPDKEGMSAVSKRMDSRRTRMDAMAGGRQETQPSGEDTQDEEKVEKKARKFSFMDPGAARFPMAL